MTDNMTYETYKEVPHQHRYDTVVEWKDLRGRLPWDAVGHRSIIGKRATRVMCSDCLDVKELN